MSATSSPKSPRVLVLWCSDNAKTPDHRSSRPALDHLSRHILYHDCHTITPGILSLMPFDVIILHHSLLALRSTAVFYDVKWQLRWLGTANALKIALPCDDYDRSAMLDEWLHDLQVTAIATCVPADARSLLYPLCSQHALMITSSTYALVEHLASLPHGQPTGRVARVPCFLLRTFFLVALIGHCVKRGVATALCWVLGMPGPGQIQPSIYAGPSGGLRFVLHALAISRLLLGSALFRRSLFRGWQLRIGRPLARDLLRLRAMQQLLASSANNLGACIIDWSTDAQTIEFMSRLPVDPLAGPTLPPEINWLALERDLVKGKVRAIKWNHSKVTKALCYSRAFCRLGDLWLPGGTVYHLEGLRLLGQTRPDLVAALLQVLTVGLSGIGRPSRAEREATGSETFNSETASRFAEAAR